MFLLLFGIFAITGGASRAETATQAVDRVWDTYVAEMHNKDGGLFARKYLLLSQRVAKEQGINVIAPIMARAKSWKSEECLIFVPLVVFLPQDKSIPVLTRYKKEGKPWERQAAEDFLIEMNMSDTKKMVQGMTKK